MPPPFHQGSALDTDAYRHLPHLRERIAPPEASALRVTPQTLALWDQRARDQGRGADWRWSDEQLEATRSALLGPAERQHDLWVFGYGSLMWDPGFHFAEVRLAELPMHRRRFSCRTVLGRGSPECPGLMLTLEPQAQAQTEPEPVPAACSGLAFRIDAAMASHESGMLWRREMIRGIYQPRLLPVHTPQGAVTALVFAANTAHDDHVGELPLDEAAAIIARAEGVLGSNRQYLEQLVWQLEHLGLDDRYLRQLLQRVQQLGPG
jgi:cation transport protein ChaC